MSVNCHSWIMDILRATTMFYDVKSDRLFVGSFGCWINHQSKLSHTVPSSFLLLRLYFKGRLYLVHRWYGCFFCFFWWNKETMFFSFLLSVPAFAWHNGQQTNLNML
jgi:hypothetical protein